MLVDIATVSFEARGGRTSPYPVWFFDGKRGRGKPRVKLSVVFDETINNNVLHRMTAESAMTFPVYWDGPGGTDVVLICLEPSREESPTMSETQRGTVAFTKRYAARGVKLLNALPGILRVAYPTSGWAVALFKEIYALEIEGWAPLRVEEDAESSSVSFHRGMDPDELFRTWGMTVTSASDRTVALGVMARIPTGLKRTLTFRGRDPPEDLVRLFPRPEVLGVEPTEGGFRLTLAESVGPVGPPGKTFSIPRFWSPGSDPSKFLLIEVSVSFR